ncbi:MAG: serine/threonine-protein kinase [Verrucomicrobiota bacterium]
MNDNSTNTSSTKLILPRSLAGTSLKHFRLEGLLGEGGMGLVYRAHDSRLHRAVAVKLLSSELISDADRKQRFLQEARAAARISHPAVAQIYDADEQDGVTFIVMELVEGKTVRELIRSKELDLLGAIDIGLQVAEGLAKAHELGIVHRDVKPANVMRTKDGHVKILDFGLAKLLDDRVGARPSGDKDSDSSQVSKTQSGMLMGTPAYMSPEQARAVPVDFRADIFSVGALLFEMATGQSPFQRDNFMDTLHAVAFDVTPSMNGAGVHVPPEVERIVSRCLQKRPEDRYPSARMLADELRRVRRDTETGLAQKTSWRQRIIEVWEQMRQQPPSRSAWFAAGAIGLGLALYFSVSKIGLGGMVFLGFGGLFFYRHIRDRPHRIQEQFVRRISKIPEVRLIAIQDHQLTVVVDHPVAQLYGRINGHLRSCNRKLYFGEPMTVSVLHELGPGQILKILRSPGVQYVREDVVQAI